MSENLHLNAKIKISSVWELIYMINIFKEKTNNNYDPHEKPSLTQRELFILSLIAKGYNNIEISDIVNISYHTVKIHVSSILRKFNAKTRAQAAIRAVKCGIV